MGEEPEIHQGGGSHARGQTKYKRMRFGRGDKPRTYREMDEALLKIPSNAMTQRPKLHQGGESHARNRTKYKKKGR